jgi:hypothetical protein
MNTRRDIVVQARVSSIGLVKSLLFLEGQGLVVSETSISGVIGKLVELIGGNYKGEDFSEEEARERLEGFLGRRLSLSGEGLGRKAGRKQGSVFPRQSPMMEEREMNYEIAQEVIRRVRSRLQNRNISPENLQDFDSREKILLQVLLVELKGGAKTLELEDKAIRGFCKEYELPLELEDAVKQRAKSAERNQCEASEVLSSEPASLRYSPDWQPKPAPKLDGLTQRGQTR